MGVKISKHQEVIEQRFNHLKSMVSNASEFIDNFDSKGPDNIFKKEPLAKMNIKLESSPKDDSLNTSSRKLRPPNRKKSALMRGASASSNSPDNRRLSEVPRSPRQDLSETQQMSFEIATEQLTFNLEPLTLLEYYKEMRKKVDSETKAALKSLLEKADKNLVNNRLYIHSEIPLDDEKPMEEKSCKVVNTSADQGAMDYDRGGRYHLADLEDAWDVYENSKQHFYELGIAVSCRKGESADVSNQDNYFVYVDAYTKVYTVYDGHGPYGNLVSYFVCTQLAKSLLEEPTHFSDPVKAIKWAYQSAEQSLKVYAQKKTGLFDIHLSGTCATTVIQKNNFIYIGQLGDSKVMIGRKSKNKKGMMLEQLTYDHVPYSLEEKKRIYNRGGEVRIWNGDGDERVFAKGRVYPCLATTRSLGDEIGSIIGIISEPEISAIEINPQTDVFLLIGSSPIFTYLDDNEILNVMNYANVSKIRETADILIKKAKNAWIQNENTYDDMTLIITYL